MSNTVYTRTYPAPPCNQKEILRYAGVHGALHELEPLLRECLDEAREKASYKVCYREFPIKKEGDILDLGFVKTSSSRLQKNLSGCDRIVLFAATVGLEFDRLVARYATVSPVKALLFQAIGTERIESLCNAFEQDLAAQKFAEGSSLRPRFSPGYGDLPLELQREIFTVLDCPRKIGLSLNQSLLMSPTKSVTALIGLSSQKSL